MKKATMINRVLLLVTFLISAHLIASSIDGKPFLSTSSYTVAFGVLMVASLLLIILGTNILESKAVVVISTLIPLGLSMGLINEWLPKISTPYLIFTIVGWTAVLVSRLISGGRTATGVLILVHGISGLIIFGLPIWASLSGTAPLQYLWVGVGGGLIGIGGMLLSFLKVGKPILPKETILNLLPLILLLMAAAFSIGFAAM
jgi:hypothetical protein